MTSQVSKEKYALSDSDMLAFCKKHSIPANLVNLDKFNEDPESANQFCIIYTGEQPNQYNTPKLENRSVRYKNKHYGIINQPHTEHWLGLFGDQVFDSYGYFEDYVWPSDIHLKPVTLFPKRLQEFDTVVCGEYVLCFLSFVYSLTRSTNVQTFSNIGRDFCHRMQFSTDRRENDEKVLRWYEENK